MCHSFFCLLKENSARLQWKHVWMCLKIPFSSTRNTASGILYMWSLKEDIRINSLSLIIYHYMYQLMWIQWVFIQILIILLMSSIFFRTFRNSFFFKYFPPTVTNVQKVSSIMSFSLFFVEFSKRKLKFTIFSWSSFVWVKESNMVTSLSRVRLQTIT